MKHRPSKILKLLLIVLTLVLSVSLSSCELSRLFLFNECIEHTDSDADNICDVCSTPLKTDEQGGDEQGGDEQDGDEQGGENEGENQDGDEQDGDEGKDQDAGSTVIEQTVINNNITVNGSATDATALGAAKGLRSAVSIYCKFEVTTGGNSIWNPTPTTQTYYSTGSGVIYKLDANGNALVITNFHVVYEATSDAETHISDEINLYLYGMEHEDYAIPATYVGGSANYDIAVLSVKDSQVLKDALSRGTVSPVTVANSDTLCPGMTTIAIGNPSTSDASLSGLSVTRGIVSVDSEYITMTKSDNSGEATFRVVRTDTPVNSGNSGGGLFNQNGELIGIVNAKISSSSVESVGYAIPSNVAIAVAENIINYCLDTETYSVMRVILGVTVSSDKFYTEYDEKTGMLIKKEEIVVYEITEGSLAEELFLKDDIILSVTVGAKTTEITRRHHLIDALLYAGVGDSVSFKIVRGGEEKTVSIVIPESALTAY